MTVKEQLLATIGALPDDATIEQALQRLSVVSTASGSSNFGTAPTEVEAKLRHALRPENVRFALEELSPDASFEELLDECLCRDELLIALDEIDAGEVVSHEEAMQIMRSWLK